MAPIDRPRLVVAGLVLLVVAGLFVAGSGGGSLVGTVAPNEVPEASVTVSPGDPGSATVRFETAGDWARAALSVETNRSLAAVDGDRRLERVGDAVTLQERDGGDTYVHITVTASGSGDEAVVYRRTVRL